LSLSDGQNQYLYDGEGRMCAVQTPSPLGTGYPALMVEYIYDAEGRRVAKGRITAWSCDLTINTSTGLPNNGFVVQASYILDQDGNQVTELDQDEQWVHTNLYVEGTLLATFANDNLGIHFHIDDWLGSRRGLPELLYQQDC